MCVIYFTGNKNVYENIQASGWGVVITAKGKDKSQHVLEKLYGPVVTDSKSAYFIGATHGWCS